MSSAAITSSMPVADPVVLPPSNMQDLLYQLGEIPPARVRTWPAAGHATVKDLVALNERKESLYELVDGTLVEKAMGFQEGLLSAYLIRVLGTFVAKHKLGLVTGGDTMLRLGVSLVRLPDVAFIAAARLPRGVPKEAVPKIAPDLAIEVLSPSNTKREMQRKRAEYFAAGSSLVWCIDPRKRTLEDYDSPVSRRLLRESDKVDGGTVLPGFSLEMRLLFAELDWSPEE